jgi:hypothetical protein
MTAKKISKTIAVMCNLLRAAFLIDPPGPTT